ncbi:MAG: hypothetical protein K9N34_05010 [Candidatus Marinimicrobia bacterium]|nr:hypothetical protein [Candidatus Neomarinimicrobiota bacterium]MCF7839926.1 hypothetical protein [Candidatus Neomarinimicrobiota bacterium]MCF7901995.1 hypothetical protein [Candidatus Neomarinimicrobiota bacterium]
MARDKRLIARRRGGLLENAHHHLLALWAADCAEHVLYLFTKVHPDDDRPAMAIEQARAWVRGEISVGAAREAAFQAHAAARETDDPIAEAVARAAGQAVSTPHMADHAPGAAYYAMKAVRLLAGREAAREEHAWQHGCLPEPVRELIITTQKEQPALSKWIR